MQVTKQRVRLHSSRQRICSYVAARDILAIYAKATLSGIALGAAAGLLYAVVVVGTGGAAAVAGAGLMAAAGSFAFKSAADELKYKKGARTCQPFSPWAVINSANLGNPVTQTHPITCGRPITGAEQWIKIEEEEGVPSVSPGIAVVDSGTISIGVREE